MNDLHLTVEYMPIEELQPYERNARKHEPRDIAAIRESIEQFGFNDPIGIWHDTIVEGHGRLFAARELGMTEVPVIRLDHLDDEGRRAYAIAHNKTAENSEWDMPVLAEELRDIEKYFDMTDFGFDKNFKAMSEPPDNLDADTGYELGEISVKFTFANYDAYAPNERELKNMADIMGAEFAVIKT